MSTWPSVVIGTLPCNGTVRHEESSLAEMTQWRALMAVYLGAILILSVTFNSTLCLMFYKKTHLLTVSNCFVLNLICCQMCISIVILPVCLATVVTPNMVVSGAWCDVQGFAFTVMIVANQMALLAISLDRNYAIMNSLRYPNVFTHKLCVSLICVSWAAALLLGIPPVMRGNTGRYKFHQYQSLCTLDWSSNSVYLFLFCILSFGIPICIQSCCYFRILMAALGHSKRARKIYPATFSRSRPASNIETTDSSTSSGSLESDDSLHGSIECKAVRTIFVIAFAYGMCWVPYFIESLLSMSNVRTSPNFSAAAICFVFASGILNPVIYAYMNRVTRREIGKFLCGHFSSNNSDERVSTTMAVYSQAWLSQYRTKSKSFGAVNNEMGTIIEENEERVKCDSRLGQHTTVTRFMGSQIVGSRSEKISPLSDKFMFCSETDPVNKHSEIVICSAKETHIEGSKTVPNADLDRSRDKCTKKITRQAAWNIVKTEKFVSERRKTSGEEYFSNQQRKKRRDYGSFLYFEHFEPDKLKSCAIKLRTGQDHETDLSADHVQSISGDLKFRLDSEDNEHADSFTDGVQIRKDDPKFIPDYIDSAEFISAIVTSSSNSPSLAEQHEHINVNDNCLNPQHAEALLILQIPSSELLSDGQVANANDKNHKIYHCTVLNSDSKQNGVRTGF